jgi:hypothetical protein
LRNGIGATRLAIADQVEAGIDIISDGELRRQRFVYEMYDRISGIERQQRPRKLGASGYDMAPKFYASGKGQGAGKGDLQFAGDATALDKANSRTENQSRDDATRVFSDHRPIWLKLKLY